MEMETRVSLKKKNQKFVHQRSSFTGDVGVLGDRVLEAQLLVERVGRTFLPGRPENGGEKQNRNVINRRAKSNRSTVYFRLRLLPSCM